MLYSSGKRAGSARGLEHLQNRPRYVSMNDLDQKVENTAALVNDDGTAHVAYEAAPGTYIYSLIEKQKKGFPLSHDEQQALADFWAKNPTAGLASLDHLGGNHKEGIKTEIGAADKYTTDSSSYSRAERRQGKAASFSF